MSVFREDPWNSLISNTDERDIFACADKPSANCQYCRKKFIPQSDDVIECDDCNDKYNANIRLYNKHKEVCSLCSIYALTGFECQEARKIKNK